MGKPKSDERPFGVGPLLEGKAAQDWNSPEVSHDLRTCMLNTDAMFRAASGQRAKVTRILGGEAPYSHGIAADVSIEGLPGVQALDPAGPVPSVVTRMIEQLNANTPRPDGLETFTANGARILIRVPLNSPPRSAAWWGEWYSMGATGMRRHNETTAANLEGRMTVARKRVYFPKFR